MIPLNSHQFLNNNPASQREDLNSIYVDQLMYFVCL
jgi:hypothetical protein